MHIRYLRKRRTRGAVVSLKSDGSAARVQCDGDDEYSVAGVECDGNFSLWETL